MTTIAVIPARGGSTRIPNKNIRHFFGKPIIAYSIEKAFESLLFDKVVVSTDSEAIAQVARNYGADVWMRNPDLGRNEVGTQAVVAECLYGINAPHNAIACCIYATAPLMDVGLLAQGLRVLTTKARSSYVFSVGYPPLQDAAQFYWGKVGSFLCDVPLINTETRVIRIPKERVCDINTFEDWAMAELLYSELIK